MSKRRNKPRVALTFGENRVVVQTFLGRTRATLEVRYGLDAMGVQRWALDKGPVEQLCADGSKRRFWREDDVNDLLASIFERLAEVKRIARLRSKKGGAS